MNDEPAPTAQQIIDGEHLRLLAIFHYIFGAIYLFFSCFALLYVIFGMMIALGPELFQNAHRPDHGPPAVFGLLIAAFGAFFVIVGWTIGGLTIYSGRSIQLRQRRVLSLVMAVINCAWVPFGTILGVFTLVVLLRRSVAALYGVSSP